MRVLTALGLCIESGAGRYLANEKTGILTLPQGIDSFKTWFVTFNQPLPLHSIDSVNSTRFDLCMPTAAKLPEYLRIRGYQNPQQSIESPFAHTFGDEFFAWLKKNPDHSAVFNGFMATRRQGTATWHDVYPVRQELVPTSGLEKDTVLLVDVGGNQGHDLTTLSARYPGLPGTLILQDLQGVIDKVKFSDNRMIAMVHNFFDPQFVKST